MSEQRSTPSESGRPPGLSRGRSHSNASRRGGLSSRPPSQAYQPSATHYPSLQDPSSGSQPGYHGQYAPSSSSYAQRGPYSGGQYTMTPPTSVPHQPSTQQYAYPSILAHDTSMQSQNLMGYSTNMLVPMPHTPIYTYPPHSPEGPSPPGHSYGNTPVTTPGLYASAPSPHPHLTPPGTSQSMSPSYSTASPYGPRYAASPYAYPQPSFSHTGNSPYQGQFSYGQQYRPAMSVATEQEPQGTWWYLPPGTRPAPSPHYDAYVNPYPPIFGAPTPHDADAYTSGQQSGPSVLAGTSWSMSPSHQPPLSPFTTSPSSHPHMQRQPAPEPPPPLSDPPSRPESELTRSDSLASPVAPNRPDRMYTRKPYHPNPPSNRSEWVMWAGNVPSDATHDELWHFFNRSPSPPPAGNSQSRDSGASPGSIYGGVASIHLISRSNCAFVNFQTDAHLTAAIQHFNGQPLRPHDPRCPRLVCRVRAREDDLKAGVGGQRGAGVHVRNVKEQKAKAKARAAASPGESEGSRTSPLSSPDDPVPTFGSLSISSDDELVHGRRGKKPAQHSSSSGSYASTSSSFLSQYFPKRYFILKSLTQFDLDLSVEKGLWATQRHNEGILDQAFRTSKDVYLIFGVNKSGEFYGYARMAGPVLHHHSEQRKDSHQVSWAARSSVDPPPARRTSSSAAGGSGTAQQPGFASYLSPSEGRTVDESPLPLETPEASLRPPPGPKASTAPTIMYGGHNLLSSDSEGIPHHGQRSYKAPQVVPAAPAILAGHAKQQGEDIRLDPLAPVRAVKHPEALTTPLPVVNEAEGRNELPVGSPGIVSSPPDMKGKRREGAAGSHSDDGPSWGDSFRVEWLRTARLPFYRTRHLRNPWNHDREVKVSRDGTELDPSVGQALLEEWDKPEPPEPPARSATKSQPADLPFGAQGGKG